MLLSVLRTPSLQCGTFCGGGETVALRVESKFINVRFSVYYFVIIVEESVDLGMVIGGRLSRGLSQF